MQKGFLASLLAVALLVGTAGAAVKLTGIEYTYPQMPNQDPEITQQDPALEKLADGRVGIGAPGAVWVAWNHPQAMVLFDLGELPSQYLITQLKIWTSEDYAHQHIGEVEVYTSTDQQHYHHVVTIKNPEKKLEANPAAKKIYSFGTEHLALRSRYVLLVFHKSPDASNQIIEEVEFWAAEPEKLPFTYTYPTGPDQDENVLTQDPQGKKLTDGGKGWGGSTAIFGGWGSGKGISIVVDFGKWVALQRLVLWTSEDNPNQHLEKIQIYVSSDGENFTFHTEAANPEPRLDHAPDQRKIYPIILEQLGIVARYIKIITWRDPAARQQVLEEVEVFGHPAAWEFSKQIPSAVIKGVEVNTYSSVKIDLGDYLSQNPDLEGCLVYVGEDFFNDARERLAYDNWWWLDEGRELLVAGLAPGREYYLAVGGAADGAASRCLKPVSVKLPEVLAVEKVGDVFGVNAFPYFAPGSAHNLRPREEEEAMFQQQIQWLREAKVKYNRWWFLDERGIRPYLENGITYLTWMRTDPAAIREANRMGVWLFASSNEPNLAGISPQDYALMVQEGYEALKGVSQQNILAAPVIHGIEAENWLRQFYQAGAKDYFDVLDIHMYQQKSLPVPPGLAPGSPEGVLLQLARLKTIMAEFGDEDKPIIITETGCPTYTGNNWAVKSTPEMQANFVVRAHLHMIASGVKRIFWYALQDEGTDPNNMEENFGLIDYYGNPKPAYYAYKTMIEQLGETVYHGPTSGLANPYYGYSFAKPNGGYVSCLWDARGQSKAKVRVPDGEVLLVERNGERQVLPNPTGILELSISEAPVYIHSSLPLEVIEINQ